MPNEFYGDYAVTLPNIFPSIGDQMRYNQERQDKIDSEERDRADRKSERDYQRQQQNRAYNLGQIDSKTAFDKFKVGQQAVDNYSLKKLDEVRNKALTEYVNLDPAEMQYRLNQDLQPLFQWDTMAKTGYQNLEKTLTELKKQNPSLNVSDAYDIAMSKFADDYMKQTPNGWEAKNPMEIKETDYQSLFDDPDILGQITDDSSGLGEFIQGFKPQETENSEVKDNKGRVHSYAYTAKLTPFTEAILGDDGKSISRRIKSESVDMGGGNTIDVLPEREYQALISNPQAKAGLSKIWVNEKDQRAQDYIRKYKRPIDKNARDLMMRQIAKEQAEFYDISGVKEKEVDKTPKPPSYTFNIGNAEVNDVYKTIDDRVNKDLQKGYGATRINALNTDAQNTIMDFVRKTSGNPDINYSNVFLRKNSDGEIGVYRTTKGKDGGKEIRATTDKLIGYLPKVGTNIKVQPGVGEKRSVIQEGNTTTLPTKNISTKKKIKDF